MVLSIKSRLLIKLFDVKLRMVFLKSNGDLDQVQYESSDNVKSDGFDSTLLICQKIKIQREPFLILFIILLIILRNYKNQILLHFFINSLVNCLTRGMGLVGFPLGFITLYLVFMYYVVY